MSIWNTISDAKQNNYSKISLIKSEMVNSLMIYLYRTRGHDLRRQANWCQYQRRKLIYGVSQDHSMSGGVGNQGMKRALWGLGQD